MKEQEIRLERKMNTTFRVDALSSTMQMNKRAGLRKPTEIF